jgi:hypothetical protein
MTVVPYRALVARLDATARIAYLRELNEEGSPGVYGRDDWPLHLAGYAGHLALAAGDAVAFVAQLNKYDGAGRRLCTDLPSLSAERDAPDGAYIDPPMRAATSIPPLTYRFEAPTAIVKQELLVRVFHLPVDVRHARVLGSRVFERAHERGELAGLAGYRTLQDAGWWAVYYEWQLAMPAGLIHARVTFMRPDARSR